MRARASDDFDKELQRIETQTAESQHLPDIDLMLRQVKECSVEVAEDVKTAQEDWMRAQTQLVGYNAWSFAWSEAVQLGHSSQRESSQPPNYEQTGPSFNMSNLSSLLNQTRTTNAAQMSSAEPARTTTARDHQSTQNMDPTSPD
ncbi:hypothetical protein CF319_g6137 [Tilletia indica]|nr:hypothetical protein CF319_g6137 [Tilletia indica]